MAEFDESKLITALHPEKAEVGKKYYFNDSLYLLKGTVEGETEIDTENVGILASVVDGVHPFEKMNGIFWEFIYPYEELPEELMSNRQFAEWIAKENGQYTAEHWNTIYTEHDYAKGHDEEKVPSDYRIRPWGSDEWVVPTVAIYLRDCK